MISCFPRNKEERKIYCGGRASPSHVAPHNWFLLHQGPVAAVIAVVDGGGGGAGDDTDTDGGSAGGESDGYAKNNDPDISLRVYCYWDVIALRIETVLEVLICLVCGSDAAATTSVGVTGGPFLLLLTHTISVNGRNIM